MRYRNKTDRPVQVAGQNVGPGQVVDLSDQDLSKLSNGPPEGLEVLPGQMPAAAVAPSFPATPTAPMPSGGHPNAPVQAVLQTAPKPEYAIAPEQRSPAAAAAEPHATVVHNAVPAHPERVAGGGRK